MGIFKPGLANIDQIVFFGDRDGDDFFIYGAGRKKWLSDIFRGCNLSLVRKQ
jgi:hypothetical protein